MNIASFQENYILEGKIKQLKKTYCKILFQYPPRKKYAPVEYDRSRGEINMSLIKKINNGKSTIEVYSLELTKEEKKENLIHLYKTINDIADSQREKGNDVNDWFYTKSELEKMKESGKYNFL